MSHDTANMLPTGWTKCSIGDVTLPVSKINPEDDPDQEIDYIDISSIDNTRHTIGSVKQYRLRDAPSRARQIVRAGDVLFATVRPYLRNIAGVPNDYDKQIASTGFSVLRPAKDVRPAFLFYKAISKDFVNALSEIQYGVSYPAVTDDQVRGQSLWLPPMEEQHRIVAKIEELFSELDKGIESLKAARAQLITYRQAVLKHAFEGKLTARWREENKDKLETPEHLLARIKQERTVRYELQLQEWKAAVKEWEASGKSGKKPSKPRPISLPEPFTDMELTGLPEIPELWRWAKLGDLFSVYVGATPNRKNQRYWNGEISWISSGEVRFATINRTSETITQDGLTNTSTELHPIGTVMLGMIGEGKTRGQAAITNIEACHNQNTAAIRVSESDIQPEYVYDYLLYRYEYTRRVGSGNNQKALNKERVSNLPIPLSALDEQAILVQELEKHLSVIAHIDSEISSQLASANSLRQSILKTAFAGQLVAQDPNDEAASNLLDRIKAEKDRNSKKGETRKKGKTTA